MEKPFTLKVNDLQQELINSINNANLPCYALKNILLDIIKLIENADNEEITKYYQEIKESD